MRKLRKLALSVITLLCAPAVYSYQLGIFDIKPFVTVEGRYDDNITSVETGEKDDVSAFFVLGLEGTHESKTQTIKISGSIDQEVFAQEDNFNSTSQYLDLDYKKEFSSYDRLTFANEFIHADRPRSLADEFVTTAGRFDYYLNRSDLHYGHDFTEKFSLQLKYTNQIYDPSVSTSSNSSLNKPGLQADYQFNSFTTGSLLYDYHNYNFDPGGTAHRHSPAVAVRQYLTEQFYADIKAGSDFIRDTNNDDTAHPNFSFGLTNEMDETTQAGLIFVKEHSFNYDSSDVFDNWRVSIFGNRQISERVSLNGVLFSGGGEFQQSGTKQKFNGLGVTAGYDINTNVQATLHYMFSRNDSSSAGDDYQKNTVSLGMRVKF